VKERIVSLYLAVFDGDEELFGWVFGHYSDFDYFCERVAEVLAPELCPILLNHSDCDGEWSVKELPNLRKELQVIAKRFRELPPQEPVNTFEHTREYRVGARSLYDCFHNVDGENVIEALDALCEVAMRTDRPILFQ
jgi:hypothetical protein